MVLQMRAQRLGLSLPILVSVVSSSLILLAAGDASGPVTVITAGEKDDGTGIGHLGGAVVNSKGGSADSTMDMVKHIFMPLIGLVVGGVLMRLSPEGSTLRNVAKLILYFGAQTGMNLYMKAVLSTSPVSTEDNLKGLPAGFAVTGLQQLTSFILFGAWVLISQGTSYPYTPQKLEGKMQAFAVILFSFSFMLNIALNNYSLSLIPISSNLIIRSCLPLATLSSQVVIAKVTGEEQKDIRILEIGCMLAGVCFAGLACYAEHAGAGADSTEGDSYVFGVIVCIVSLFSGALNMALAGMLGTTVKLNALDTTIYMSLPVVVFLIVPVFFYSHPVKDEAWQQYIGSEQMTDWSIFSAVCGLSPMTVALATFSGGLALMYNVLQYGIVQTLSPAHTTFAGNFNKAATIVLSLLVGLESLPEGKWGPVMLFAVFGNIVAFTAFNVVKFMPTDDAELVEGSDSAEDDSDEGIMSS